MIVLPSKKEQKEEKSEPLAVNSKDAAKMLGVCERTIHNLTKKGKIACKKVGWRSLYSVSSLKTFLETPDTE